LKNRRKKQTPNPNNDDDPVNADLTSSNVASTSTATSTSMLTTSESASTETLIAQEMKEIKNILSENGVFSIAAMTSAATLPSHMKSIEITKHHIKFKTNNGYEGSIDLHTNEEEVRGVREGFRNINVNYVNRSDISIQGGGIEYSIEIDKKSGSKGGQTGHPGKIKLVGSHLSQVKFYKDVLPKKIPLRKTDISPADWRIEKYISWERQKKVGFTDNEIEDEEENQFNSRVSSSIFDDPPDTNTAVNNWKKGRDSHYYPFNPPLVSELEQDDSNFSLLSDYIEYLSEGLKFIQYNNEINRRSELRYCSYLDKAIEIYREASNGRVMTSDILKLFLSDDHDYNNKDRIYLCKKKMVGKRINKLMSQCQLSWNMLDCVEEVTINFLTNTVQEENFGRLVTEINKEYRPKYDELEDNEDDAAVLLEQSKNRLVNFQGQINLENIRNQVGQINEKDELIKFVNNLQTERNKFEYDIAEDGSTLDSIENHIEKKEYDIIEAHLQKRRVYLSRLDVLLENIRKQNQISFEIERQ
jgi:hypothetical protein